MDDDLKIVRTTSTFDCIEACPVRALDAGPLAELERKYGRNREAVDFKYSQRTKPAVVIKPKPIPERKHT